MQLRHFAFVAALSLAIVHSAGAQVYRCTAAGKTIYTDQPCPGGRMIETDINSVRELDQSAARAASEAIDQRTQQRYAIEERAREERVRRSREDQSFAAAMAATPIPEDAPYYGFAGWGFPDSIIPPPPRPKPVKPVAAARYIEIKKK